MHAHTAPITEANSAELSSSEAAADAFLQWIVFWPLRFIGTTTTTINPFLHIIHSQ